LGGRGGLECTQLKGGHDVWEAGDESSGRVRAGFVLGTEGGGDSREQKRGDRLLGR